MSGGVRTDYTDDGVVVYTAPGNKVRISEETLDELSDLSVYNSREFDDFTAWRTDRLLFLQRHDEEKATSIKMTNVKNAL